MEQTSEQLPFEDLQPQDDDDRNRRALFFCHCIYLYSKRMLELLMNRADTGEFGDAVQHHVKMVSEWQVDGAFKILTCINLHMAGLDHGGSDSPAWVLFFFSEAARETDEMFPEPTAIEVIARHGSWKREKMVRGVAEHILEILGFTEDKEALQKEIESNLVESAPYRTELLLFALSQPPEALRNHLESLAG
jgi:hypothetical protein